MLRLCLLLLAIPAIINCALADDARLETFSLEFQRDVLPILQKHCHTCHNEENPEADLDLTVFRRLQDVTKSHHRWAQILERMESGEMPPEDAESKPTDRERRTVTQWIRSVREFEAARNAGDPGPVLARRLSNAEYDYSIRDLTGIDMRPTNSFPIDPANEAGFDNSGESLTMSPELMNKYLQAARFVVDHLVLTPRGIRFAPYPVVTDTDRDKYCVNRIVDFYQRQPIDFADYFYAAWIYRHRADNGDANQSLENIAIQQAVSSKYLNILWRALNEESVELGPMATLLQMWNDLPAAGQASEARDACEWMRDYVLQTRKQYKPKFDNLHIEGIHKGSQAFVLWKNKQYAAHRREAEFGFLDQSNFPDNDDDRERYIAAAKKFCSVFPDAFFVSERGRDYLGTPKDEQEKGRLLSAGFHSMMGYFRDDLPLQQLILDESGQQELNDLWQELDFFTAAPQRQYQGFLWFDRTDSSFMRDSRFDFARPENKASLSESMIKQLAEVYLGKAKSNGGKDVPLLAIDDYFREINKQIRWVEQARAAAEPFHLDAVVALASRAERRPLTAADESQLRDFYRLLRERDDLSHEEAIADTIVSLLMSPRFCYRLDLLADSEEGRPLDDFELASRLSYFLWSSIPDAELLERAAAGELRQRDVLLQQTRRMVGNDRMVALAKEFGGNWLDFRRFEQHNSVDRGRFPEFNDSLRSSMFEEPVRFFVDVAQRDRSTLDFLYAKRTFVNSLLAKHYGMPDLDLDESQWQEVSDANRYGRGGLLTMAVFLTKNSPGLRTSPVKRGYWVVRRLLGERIPPPPPDVPELPEDESKLGELTLPETLARHREHTSCAGCHNRFDAIGVAFEGFGPIGEHRERDLGGRAVHASAKFPDGSERDGVDDLRRYLQENREAEFVDNLCRKLLSYALGRTLQLSDESLLRKMQSDSKADGYRFGKLIEVIVTSPQFLNKRGRQMAPQDQTVAKGSDEE